MTSKYAALKDASRLAHAALTGCSPNPESTLYLWCLTREDWGGYDSYNSAVVVAKDEDSARLIHPNPGLDIFWDNLGGWVLASSGEPHRDRAWVRPEDVEVTKVGLAVGDLSEGDVICADFHAG